MSFIKILLIKVDGTILVLSVVGKLTGENTTKSTIHNARKKSVKKERNFIIKIKRSIY